jgi:glycosyltransferase involved in cell wall biosynthesis
MTRIQDSNAIMLNNLIDVVIPTHNSEKYLQATLNSIHATCGLGIILVDDHSSDATTSLIRNNGLHHIESPGRGAFEARKAGLIASQAEFVIFLDSDDLLEEGWRQALDRLKKNSQIIGVGGRARNFGPLHESITQHSGILENTYSLIQRSYGPWPISGSLWRRKELLETFYLYPEPLALSFADDFELILRGSFKGMIETIEEVMTSYRIADGKSQRNPGASLEAAYEIAVYYNSLLNLNAQLPGRKLVAILTSRRQIQIKLYNEGKFRAFAYLLTSPVHLFNFLKLIVFGWGRQINFFIHRCSTSIRNLRNQ